MMFEVFFSLANVASQFILAVPAAVAAVRG